MATIAKQPYQGDVLQGASAPMSFIDASGARKTVDANDPLPVNAVVSAESTAEATAATPVYIEGQDAPLSQDLKGNLRVTSNVRQYAGVPSNFAVATADGTVFTLAAGEWGFIQNLDSADTLAVKLGASASTSSFNFLLACGSAQDDGKGGVAVIKDWVGAVSVATMTGTARYIAFKRAAA